MLAMQGARVQSLVGEVDPARHQLKVLHATTKSWCIQITKMKKEKKKKDALSNKYFMSAYSVWHEGHGGEGKR